MVVRLLIALGREEGMLQFNDTCPLLECACIHDRGNVVTWLLESHDLKQRQPWTVQHALFAACEAGALKAIQALEEDIPGILRWSNGRAQTTLEVALVHGNGRAVKWILAKAPRELLHPDGQFSAVLAHTMEGWEDWGAGWEEVEQLTHMLLEMGLGHTGT
jgi:hypothetical protein